MSTRAAEQPWHPGDEQPTHLGVEESLDVEDVVPGFTYPVARLFA